MDEEILETAKSICACGAEDEALLKRLCAASAQALERELREGVAPEVGSSLGRFCNFIQNLYK